MRHAGESALLDADPGAAERGGESQAVRQQGIDLRADDRYRRQSAQVGLDQVDPRILHIRRAAREVIGEPRQVGCRQRLGVGGGHARGQGLARIGDRIDRDDVARHRHVMDARGDRGGDREVAARALADERQPRGVAAPAARLVENPAIGGDRIIVLSGELVLRGVAIFDRDDHRAELLGKHPRG